MAPATSSSSSAQRLIRFSGSLRRTEAPRRPSPQPKKLKPMSEVMAKARHAVVERVDYSDVSCQQCGSGERADELLLCDKCDKGFHMKCLRPIVVRVPIGSWLCPKCSGRRRVRSRDFFVFVFFVSRSFLFLECEIRQCLCVSYCFLGMSQKKIIDFFRIQKCTDKKNKFSSPQGEILLTSSAFDTIIIVVVVVIEICVASLLGFRIFCTVFDQLHWA